MVTEFWQQVRSLADKYPHIWLCFQNNPSAPAQLIRYTVERGATYLETPEISALSAEIRDSLLSPSQQKALRLCLASSPIILIQGIPGSGKDRITKFLAETAIYNQQRLLLLSPYSAKLCAYENLPGIVCPIQAISDTKWLQQCLQQKHLYNLKMDFLPLYLQPDELLNQLRSPQELEYWLGLVHSGMSIDKLAEQLRQKFPKCSIPRIQLLAHRLQKLSSLLESQFYIIQKARQLSSANLHELATKLHRLGKLTFTGTIAEYLQIEYYSPSELPFDLTIVTESEELTWLELIVLAVKTRKLVLFGNLTPSSRKQKPFTYLGELLLPCYRYQLYEQFRQHYLIGKPIYESLYNRTINHCRKTIPLTVPHLGARLQWHDVRGSVDQVVNPLEGKLILSVLHQYLYCKNDMGILTFSSAQRDWFQNNLPQELKEIKLGTIEEWVGQERRIVLISCAGGNSLISFDEIVTALSRAQDYLLIFGNLEIWQKSSTPLEKLLANREIYREREVRLV